MKYVGQGLLRGCVVTWAALEATQLYKCIMRTSVNTRGWFISDKSAAKRLNYNNNTRASGNTKSALCRPHMWSAAASSSSPPAAPSNQHYRRRGSGIQTLELNESAPGRGRRTAWHKLKLAGLWSTRLSHRSSSPALASGMLGTNRPGRGEPQWATSSEFSSSDFRWSQRFPTDLSFFQQPTIKASIKVEIVQYEFSVASIYDLEKVCRTSAPAPASLSSHPSWRQNFHSC